MCSYCGCEAETVIAQLMADHEEIVLLARRAETALRHDDPSQATALCGEIAALFDTHGYREEKGLFAELRDEGVAEGVVAGLEADHRRLQVGLALLAAGDLSSLGRVLSSLLEHAEREDTDLFPAALQLLPSDAWARVRKASEGS